MEAFLKMGDAFATATAAKAGSKEFMAAGVRFDQATEAFWNRGSIVTTAEAYGACRLCGGAIEEVPGPEGEVCIRCENGCDLSAVQ